MKQVSDAYKLGMSALLRNRSYVRVTFSNIDSDAAKDGAWVGNGSTDYSEVDTLDYAYEYGDTCATLELNRWALDGNTVVASESAAIRDGFVSSQMSDENGEFSTAVVLTREFSEPQTFPGLTLTFDSREQEWPVSLTVDFYLNGEIVQTAEITPGAVKTSLDAHVALCDKIVLTVGSCLPYRRPRLESVLYGVEVVFENDDIISTNQSHDVDPLSRRLPQESMSFTILDYLHRYDPDNPQGIYAYIDEKAPVAIQFGFTLPSGEVEWVKADKYVLDGKPSAKDNQATFTGTGLIGSLTGTFYKSKLGSKNLYDMAEEVLLDADLTPTEQGENPWELDESLKEMYTTAVLPIDTHMNCLQLIAHAARCRLYTDDDNIIHIKRFEAPDYGQTTDFTLDFSTISENSQAISKTDKLKAVSVARYSYSLEDDSVRTLYEGTTTETEFHVEFSGLAQDISISVSGGTLVSSAVYGRAADLVLSSGTKSIVITGKTLAESSVVVSYPVNSSGEVDSEENPLITNDEMCTALALHVMNYLQMRNTYDADYRGNPEMEVGDIIELQTAYTPAMDALILVDEIVFNGSLSGKMKVKGLI